MNKKSETKECCSCDPDSIRMQKIDDNIKSIYTRATWLLGILVVVVLALASFLLENINEPLELYSPAWVIRAVAVFLFIYYLTIIAIYTRTLIVPNFKKPTYKTNETELQEILDGLTSDLKALASLFVLPLPFVSLLAVIVIAYLLLS